MYFPSPIVAIETSPEKLGTSAEIVAGCAELVVGGSEVPAIDDSLDDKRSDGFRCSQILPSSPPGKQIVSQGGTTTLASANPAAASRIRKNGLVIQVTLLLHRPTFPPLIHRASSASSNSCVSLANVHSSVVRVEVSVTKHSGVFFPRRTDSEKSPCSDEHHHDNVVPCSRKKGRF